MDLTRSALKVFGAQAIATAITFLGLAYFARELGASQMGVFFLFQTLLGILALPSDMGIGGAVTKRISGGQPVDEIFSTAVLLNLLPLSIIVSGIFLFADPINVYLGEQLAKFLAVAVVLLTLARLTMKVLKGELRVGETALPSMSQKIVYVGVGVALVVIGLGVFALIYGLLAGIIVMLLWGLQRSSISIGRPSLAHARSLFDYSKYNAISATGGFFYNWIDVAIIGLFLTQAHVGAYETAWRVTGVTMLFSRAIGITVFPQISAWDSEGAKARIEQLIPTALSPSLGLVIPAFFGTLLYSREILGLVFGADYATAWLVLILLMGDKVFQAVQVVVGRSLQAINRPDLAARAALISLVVNLLLNIILVWQYGIIGAAIGTVVASLLNDGLHMVYLSRFISLRFPWSDISWFILSSIGMSVSLLAIESKIVVGTLPTLTAMIAMGVVIYVGFVMISPSIRTRVKQKVDDIILPTP